MPAGTRWREYMHEKQGKKPRRYSSNPPYKMANRAIKGKHKRGI